MCCFVALCCTFLILAEATIEDRSDKEFEDMTAPEIIEAHGYPVETYTLTAKSGYILTIHRIPYGRKTPKSDDKTVVLLQHALLCSSDNWLLVGPVKGLGFILADNNYDVWMPNQRGTKYSRQHVNLTDKDPEFWDFSWHELGAVDMPDVVDYILEQTGESELLYAGHSQGATTFWTFLALNPSYSDKIIGMFALGPIAFMKRSKSPVFKACALLEKLIPEIRSEFFASKNLFHKVAKKFCSDNQALAPEICAHILFLMMGYDDPQTNKSNIHIILAHTPAGQSVKQIVHYCQGGDELVFRQYNHGPVKNKKIYGQITPPDYDLSNVKAPVYLYYGPNDALAALLDVQTLKERLGNLVKSYEVPYKLFNHLDFLIAKDINELVHDEVLKDMRAAKEKFIRHKKTIIFN